jgi:hypothetical protein
MARKTANDLRTEYNKIIEKQLSVEARIRERARQMSEKHPDVLYGYRADQDRTPYTVKEAFKDVDDHLEGTRNPDTILTTGLFLKIIAAVEKHNLAAAGIVQKTIYDELKNPKS